MPDDPRYYLDYTGTGNTLNVRHPQTLQLIMDSLRYWVQEMHVDGFRFDLAATLARELHEVDRLSAFFDVIHQDPVISQVKLIAEPWDVGEGGYQVGNFPVLWAEWNGKYRDTVRAYWRGDPGTLGELGYRLTGSSDLYEDDGRRPHASINFITAHDGFTLNDLVSYNHKHNEANGEENRDGHDDNLSYNFGVEGPTDDADIVRQRERQKRNFLATLLLSQGVPMICGGDEMGRTQRGNNNAYCQDNEIGWVRLGAPDDDRALLEFTRRVARLRREHPAFRRRKFFRGREHPRQRGEGPGLDPRRRPGDDRRGVERRLRALLRDGAGRRGDGGVERPRRADHRRRLPPPLQRRRRGDRLHRPRLRPRARVAGGARHQRARPGGGRPPPPARRDAAAGGPVDGRPPGRERRGAMSGRGWRLPFGANLREEGVEFRVWAPAHESVDVVLYGPAAEEVRPLHPVGAGWFAGEVEGIGAGARYRYRLDGGGAFPDPASRAQPDGVHEPSEVVDPSAFAWTDGGWRGCRCEELAIYELHVGTFTPEGTFDAATERLDELAALGVTAVEPMPVASFPGARNWGYDGVSLFAPQASYGGPEGLRRFVDAAHARGLAVRRPGARRRA